MAGIPALLAKTVGIHLVSGGGGVLPGCTCFVGRSSLCGARGAPLGECGPSRTFFPLPRMGLDLCEAPIIKRACAIYRNGRDLQAIYLVYLVQ